MLESGKIDPALLEQIKESGGAATSDPKNDEAMKKILEDNEKAMKEMQQSFEEKLAEAKKTVIISVNRNEFNLILLNFRVLLIEI